ncbi:MAG: hypothetical protein AMXMBFR58_14700 [Phycisphaerae bacterium]|nr:TIGR02206 family membrane protein [Phycisphaerales bacterium]
MHGGSVMLAITGAPPLDPMVEFRSFTWMHALCAGGLLFFSIVTALIGRRFRGRPFEIALAAFWGGLIIARQAFEVAWYLRPENFGWHISLPLQFCDLAPWIAAVALLSGKRWSRAVLYYWGFGLCTQAFFTPTVQEGVGHPRFWWFWLSHTHIVGGAIYDLVARGYRPTWKDFRGIVLVTFCYATTLAILNAITGFNYGFVGPSKPEAPTIIDSLGPYPYRVPVLFAIVIVLFAIMTVVWRPGSRKAPAAEPLPRP